MSKPAVVLDLGTGFIKTGLSDSPIPTHLLPNAIGRPILRSDESLSKVTIKDIMLSDECDPVRQYLDINLPVKHGIVQNWEEESMILDYVFKEKLKIKNSEHKVLITEAPANPISNRKKMCEIFFEQFGFPAIQIAPQALLVLFAQGLVTGIVLDSGDGVTHVIPITESYLNASLIGRMNLAGRDVTEQLVKLLTLRGYTFHKSSDFDTVRQIKEKLCFVSANPNIDRKISSETTAYTMPYTLTDGRIIKVSGERFECSEILFDPSLIGLEGPGMSQLLYNTIMASDINLRKKYFESVVVSGGTSMFPGLSTRVYNDLQNLVLKNILKGDKERLSTYKINIDDPPNRRFLVYQGATVLANVSDKATEPWATKQDYKEIGIERVVMKWATYQT